MIKASITIHLTQEQKSALQPLYEQAKAEDTSGRPGIVIAQCTSEGRLAVAFIPYDVAVDVCAAMGTTGHEDARI